VEVKGTTACKGVEINLKVDKKMTTKINQKVDISDGITELPRVIERNSAPSGKYVEGILYVNSDGRYAIDDYHALHCGSSVELNVCGKWLEQVSKPIHSVVIMRLGLKA